MHDGRVGSDVVDRSGLLLLDLLLLEDIVEAEGLLDSHDGRLSGFAGRRKVGGGKKKKKRRGTKICVERRTTGKSSSRQRSASSSCWCWCFYRGNLSSFGGVLDGGVAVAVAERRACRVRQLV